MASRSRLSDDAVAAQFHQEVQAAAREAASQLLSLPWELLHDGRSYLFQGRRAVPMRCRLPNRQHQPVLPTRLPIRILLVSPRPEDERTGYIDHRISAKPLMDAVDDLGELATLTVLAPEEVTDPEGARSTTSSITPGPMARPTRPKPARCWALS